MSRRVLLLEPDATARALIGRVISGEGFRVVAARTLAEAAGEGGFDAAIVDELAGEGAVLDEVRRVRRQHPLLPLVVTGTLMTPAILIEAIRLGAVDALPKPFTPAELRAALIRVVARSSAGHDRSLSYAASITEARDALAQGVLTATRAPLAEARAASAFDAEAMALEALVAELEGRDDDADRGYRATLALRREEDTPPPSPTDGLSRLALYRGATPTSALPSAFLGAPACLACDPGDLDGADSANQSPRVTVLLLGIAADARAAYFRADERRAFVLLAAAARPEAIATALDAAGVGRLSAASTAAPLDLDRIERLRATAKVVPRAVGS